MEINTNSLGVDALSWPPKQCDLSSQPSTHIVCGRTTTIGSVAAAPIMASSSRRPTVIVHHSVHEMATEIGGRHSRRAADARQQHGADEREQQHAGERDQGALDDQEAGERHHQCAHGEQHEQDERHGQE